MLTLALILTVTFFAVRSLKRSSISHLEIALKSRPCVLHYLDEAGYASFQLGWLLITWNTDSK